MNTQELSMAIEAVLFAAAEPVSVVELRRIFRRHLAILDAPEDDAPSDPAADELTAASLAPNPSDPAEVASSAAVVSDPRDDADIAQQVRQSEPQPGAIQVSSPLEHAADEPPDGVEASGTKPDSAADSADEQPSLPREDLTLLSPPTPGPKPLGQQLKAALQMLRNRWDAAQSAHGFTLVEVGDAFTFRTHARFAQVMLAMREDRPARLSRPAMESLAIVAYRQPVTKPELDQLRGVDSGGTVRLLLERRLIGVVGKKDEPGRPLLYGTTPTFLSMFNLPNLTELPSLREFNELNADSEDALRAFDGLPSLAELSSGAKQFRNDEEPSVADLDAAVARLQSTEGTTRDLLLEHGVALRQGDDETPGLPAARNANGPHTAPQSTLH